MQVFEDHDRGAFQGHPLEEGPPGGEELLALTGGRFVEAEQGDERRGEPAPLRFVGDVVDEGGGQLAAGGFWIIRLGDPSTTPNHLAERPERNPLAVRRRPAVVPIDLLRQAVDIFFELPRQPRLADARLPDDRD